MNKLTVTAKKLDTLVRVLTICLKIGIVACFAGLAVIAAGFLFDLDPYTIGTGYNSLEFGRISLQIAPEYAPDEQFVLMLLAVQILITLRCLGIGLQCGSCVRNILQPMTLGEPFHTSVSQNLKKLARHSIHLCIILNILEVATTCMYVWGYDLANLLISEKIIRIDFLTVIDLTFLIVAAVLYLLSYIFHYGEQLQKLSDETL